MNFFKNDRFPVRKLLLLSFLILGIAWGVSHSIPARASDGNIHLGAVDAQSIELGAKLEISVDVTADEAQSINFAIDSEDIAEQIQDGDISIQANPAQVSLAAGETKEIKLEIQTKTSAPDFSAKKFGLVAKSEKGSPLASTDISLSVLPLYRVSILDGSDADPFEFDSQAGTSYFRSHANGLQFVFRNLSTKPVIIHGSGVIKHQGFTPLQHGDAYQPPLIMPSAGADQPGYYTIHGVYHPDRSVVVNATKFSASSKDGE